MKNLVIDIGNSSIKTGIFADNNLVEFKKFDPNDLKLYLDEIEKGIFFDNCILSASGSIPKNFSFSGVKIKNEPMILTPETRLPINIEYKTPETLGKDRIAGMVACYNKFPKNNVLLCDIGSAITYDLLSAEGSFIGGNISPGMPMRFKALHEFTANLPLLKEGDYGEFAGQSTFQAIINGVMQGILLELSGFIQQFEKNFPNLKVLFTGGDSELFASKIKRSIFADPHIVIKGLNDIIEYNRSI